jgi:rubredoxin
MSVAGFDRPGLRPADRACIWRDRSVQNGPEPENTGQGLTSRGSIGMKKWQCIVCGLIYNEADGWPDDGIAPGTRWEDVPADWLCPDCGVGKMDFEMIEIN